MCFLVTQCIASIRNEHIFDGLAFTWNIFEKDLPKTWSLFNNAPYSWCNEYHHSCIFVNNRDLHSCFALVKISILSLLCIRGDIHYNHSYWLVLVLSLVCDFHYTFARLLLTLHFDSFEAKSKRSLNFLGSS